MGALVKKKKESVSVFHIRTAMIDAIIKHLNEKSTFNIKEFSWIDVDIEINLTKDWVKSDWGNGVDWELFTKWNKGLHVMIRVDSPAYSKLYDYYMIN